MVSKGRLGSVVVFVGTLSQLLMGSSPSSISIDRAEVEQIQASIGGQTLIVDWHGTWDYATIQEALNASADGDTIIVLPSTGSPAGAYVENVIFPARAITLRSINPDDSAIVAATIIDGNASGSVVTFEEGTPAQAVLQGFTIRNGNSISGGGIYCSSSSLTIVNCTITNNFASSPGGGMFNVDGSTPVLLNCTFLGNSAGYGGGIYNSSSNPTLTDCTFSQNTAPFVGAGGMYNYHSSPVLTNCTFNENSAPRGGGMYNNESEPMLTGCAFDRNSATYGGGIYNYVGSPTLVRCVFNQNSASGGGGVYNSYSSPVLTNCTFSGNSTSYDGGGMSNDYSAPTLTNCTFSGNSASSSGGGMCNRNSSTPALAHCTFTTNSGKFGGGIYNSSSAPTLTYCMFSGNVPSYGGGMYNTSSSPVLMSCSFGRNSASYGGGVFNCNNSSPTLTNCTFLGNSASVYGGGAYNSWSNSTLIHCTFSGNSAGSGGAMYHLSSTSALANCIVWGNAANSDSQIYGSATLTYSCIQGGWVGEGNIDVDPELMFVTGGNTRLRRASPCIDAGSNAAVPAGVTTDADGNLRFVDDPETADTGSGTAPLVDMGAYEYEPVSAERLYVDDDAAVGGDGQSWSSAYTYLQDALVASQERPGVTEIWVAEGVYRPDRDTAHPNGGGGRDATFYLVNGVAIHGGFPGRPDQEGDLSVRDPVSYLTVLSGDLAGDDGPNFVNNSENSYHVVTSITVGPSAVLDAVTVSGGNANESSALLKSGGGMYNSSSSPTLTSCTFRGNSASNGGGMWNVNNGKPRLTDCTFIGNSAKYGGGVYNGSGSPTLLNCIFTANAASFYGGGMYHSSGSLTLTNCTLNVNSASYGGGMYNSSSTPVLANCILWSSTATNGPQIYGPATVTYSCIEDGWVGDGNISADPLFVRNADAGADGEWGTEDDDYGDLHLRAGSPCIDAGDDSVIEAGWVDMDGGPRVHGAHVDMGADEFLWGDFNGDGSVNLLDIDLFVRCTTGPAIAYDPAALPEAEPGCTLTPDEDDIIAADVDADGDVDQSDFGLLQTYLVEVSGQ